VKLDFDAEQRFSCRQCGRCCRRGWDIAVTTGEADAYRRAGAERWFREAESAAEGAGADAFEPIPGHAGVLRIRKRRDGTCGFLSPEGRCRIHEELGGPRKPLTCRLFPFRFHPAEGRPPLLTASFSCPTVTENLGAPFAEQAKDLSALQRDWARLFPEPAAPALLALERRIDAGTLGIVRRTLRGLLDRPGKDGRPDLRENVARIGVLLDDWSRLRVLSLGDEALAEYLELTGSFALRDEKPPRRRRASGLARLLFRGFVFAIVAARVQLEDGRRGGLRLGLRVRLARLLFQAHGLWPGGEDLDLGAARRGTLDLARPELFAVAHNYLRSTVETLGTGRRSVVDEAAVAVAFLQAGCVLAAFRAARSGRGTVEREELVEGLMDASDLTHADPKTAYGGLLASLSGGLESCFLFGESWPQRAAAR
jgi:Fe-S-cluster containining protein